MPVTPKYTRRTPEEGILYNAMRQQWPFIRAASKAANDGKGLPNFIESAVNAYLECGMLKFGFLYAKCDQCKDCLVVAFSCKQRGLCSSCAGKRMIELGAQLVDSVIPKVKMRQWVISLPHDIRYLLAWNHEFRSAVLAAVMRALDRHYLMQAQQQGGKNPKPAAISVIHRMDQSVRLDVHWHILYADGAWCETEKGLEFLQGPPLKQEVVQQVFEDVLKRIDRQIAKLPDPIESPAETQRKCDPALSALLRNAMLGFQSDGKDAGKPQQAEFGKGPLKIRKDGRNCCKANGYSLHANRTIAPQDREGLEKLCRYLCRPAIPASRLELLENPIGNKTIRIWLKSEWEGGIKSVLVSEKDLVIRALAQIPLPFRRQLIYHGCFAGNSKARAKVVLAGDKPKGRRKKKKADDKAEKTEPEENTKMLWQIAHLRCFGWDVLKCPCGGNRTLIAAVKKKTEIERFLRFLKLWPNADERGQVLPISCSKKLAIPVPTRARATGRL